MKIWKKFKNLIYKIIYKRHDDKIRKSVEETYTFRYISYGTWEPQKAYMIIRRSTRTVGIFSDYLVFMGAIEFAVNRGYIPVIDRLHYPNVTVQKKEQYYRENAWEYFFEQPMGIGVEEAEKDNKNIVYSPTYTDANIYDGVWLNETFQKNVQLRNYWKNIAHKYIRFNEHTKALLNEERKKLDGGGFSTERILGIAVREGYTLAIKNGVELTYQFTIDEIINYAKKIMSQDKQIQKIFLTCEFKETIERFEKEFSKDRVLYISKMRYQDGDEYAWNTDEVEEIYDKKDKYDIAVNYIKEVYFLSQCDSIIYTSTSGGIAAFLMKEGDYNHIVCCNMKGIVYEYHASLENS